MNDEDKAKQRFPVYKLLREFEKAANETSTKYKLPKYFLRLIAKEDRRKRKEKLKSEWRFKIRGTPRFNTIPRKNTKENIFIVNDYVNSLDYRLVHMHFAYLNHWIDRFDELRQGNSSDSALNACKEIYKKSSTKPRPSCKKEALIALEEHIDFLHSRANYEARKHIIFSDFIRFKSIPLLLESISVETIKNMIKEARRIKNTAIVKILSGILLEKKEICQFLSSNISSTTVIKNLKYSLFISDRMGLGYYVLECLASAWDKLRLSKEDRENQNSHMESVSLYVSQAFNMRTQMLLLGYAPHITRSGNQLEASQKAREAKAKKAILKRQKISMLKEKEYASDQKVEELLGLPKRAMIQMRYQDGKKHKKKQPQKPAKNASITGQK